MSIFASLQARQQLIEALNQRIEEDSSNPDQQLPTWINDLKQQQLADIQSYKATLLTGDSQQDFIGGIPPEERQDNWQREFADGFIAYLEGNNSPLYPIWLGERYAYPKFIGFDIRRLGNQFNFDAQDACWLAVYLSNRQIFAGVHLQSPLYYQELETERIQIDTEFSQNFNGRHLEWHPNPTGIHRVSLLVDIENNENQQVIFENLSKVLEKLDTIFKPRIDAIISQSRGINDMRFV